MAGTELGKAFVQIVPSAKGISGMIKKELGPEVNSAGESTGKSFASKFVSIATKAFAVAGIGKAIKASVMEGANLEQSLGGIDTLFKGSADKMKQYASQAFKTVGVSANTYMENVTSFSAGLISSLGGDTAKAAEVANMAMIDMGDNANKMGTSMEDIQNAYQGFAKQNYTMLDNLKLGYGGTKTEMERLLADAQELTGVKYDINNLSDVYEAIHSIQENIGITGTTAKEASETVSGSFNAMKASFSDFLGNLALGNDIKPSLQNLFQTVETFLVGNLLPMVGRIFKGLPQVAEVGLIELSKRFDRLGKDIMKNLGLSLSDNSEITKAFSNLSQGIEPILESLRLNIMKIPEMFSEIGQSLVPIIEFILINLGKLKFDGIKDLVDVILPALSAGFQTFISIAGPAIEMLVSSFTNLWNASQPLVSAIAEALLPAFKILGSFLGGVFKGVLLAVSGLFDTLSVVIKILSPIIDVLVQAFKACEPVLSFLAEKIGVVIGLFTSMGNSGKKLSSRIQDAFKNIKEAVKKASQGIETAITGIKSFFTSLSEAGGSLKNLLSNAWNAIKSAISAAASTISGVINKLKSFFSSLTSSGKSLASGLKSAWSAITSAISSAVGRISGFINRIKGMFNSLRNINLRGAGTAIMNGFLGGLKAAWGGVKSFVSGIAGWIKRNKGPLSYDKKLLIPAGKAIMYGLNKGLENNFKEVKSTVSAMNAEILSEFTNDNLLKDSKFNNTVDYMRIVENSVSTEDRCDKDRVPVQLIFDFNGRRFEEFVDDITYIQNKKIKLEASY